MDELSTRQSAEFELYGTEPFDISIRRNDGTYNILYGVRLDSMKSSSERTGRKRWDVEAIGGRYLLNADDFLRLDQNGEPIFRKDPRFKGRIPVSFDGKKFSLTYEPTDERVGIYLLVPIPKR